MLGSLIDRASDAGKIASHAFFSGTTHRFRIQHFAADFADALVQLRFRHARAVVLGNAQEQLNQIVFFRIG